MPSCVNFDYDRYTYFVMSCSKLVNKLEPFFFVRSKKDSSEAEERGPPKNNFLLDFSRTHNVWLCHLTVPFYVFLEEICYSSIPTLSSFSL